MKKIFAILVLVAFTGVMAANAAPRQDDKKGKDNDKDKKHHHHHHHDHDHGKEKK